MQWAGRCSIIPTGVGVAQGGFPAAGGVLSVHMAITIRPWGKARPLAPDVPPPHAPEVDVIKLIVSDPLGFMDREYDRLRLGTGLIHRLAKMSSVDKPLAQSLLNFLRFQIPLRFED